MFKEKCIIMIRIVIFLFFVIISIGGFSQASQSKISETWDELLLANDREKNFRLPAFLDLLSENDFKNDDKIPAGWIYENPADTDYHFLAGILPFRIQNSLLIWLVSLKDETESWVFCNELDFLELTEAKITFNFDSNQTFSILINDVKYVDVPDIQIKILFSKLKYDIPDNEKDILSRKIWERLEKLLENKLLFDNDFSHFERLATVISADKKVKICTWNVEYSSGEHFFYGGLAINTSSNPIVYELKDKRKSAENPLQSVMTPDNWYGCIYYDIIENRYEKNTYYTLIGFSGNNAFSQIKLVDILTFSDNEKPNPKFGLNMFTDRYKNNRRLIFEYGKNTTMMLRYDSNFNMIVIDNLSPSAPQFYNDFRYYGPDLSYNGLRFDKGKWIYEDEIDFKDNKNIEKTPQRIKRQRIPNLETQ